MSALSRAAFVAALLPDLLALGRRLFKLYRGDTSQAREHIERIAPYRDELLAERERLDRERDQVK